MSRKKMPTCRYATRETIMILSMQFKDYLESLKPVSNHPASMALLLAPFGIAGAPTDSDDLLMVGHIADELSQLWLSSEHIDISDIIEASAELGLAA
jgi:hypothetical protein